MLKGVLFDLDDTLIDWSGQKTEWGVMEREHVSQVFAYLRAEVYPLDDLDAFCDEFFDRLDEAWMASRLTMAAPHLGQILVGTAIAMGVPAEKLDAHGLLEAFHWEKIAGSQVFPEVPETLRLLLSHGLKIGIVTNAHQPMWLRDVEIKGHGLFEFFDTCRIAASDVGYLKPHPAIFKAALKCINTTPEETVFVGDSLEADIAGAKAAGMRTVLRRLTYRPIHDPIIVPDAALNSLDELPGILDTWYPGWRECPPRTTKI